MNGIAVSTPCKRRQLFCFLWLHAGRGCLARWCATREQREAILAEIERDVRDEVRRRKKESGHWDVIYKSADWGSTAHPTCKKE